MVVCGVQQRVQVRKGGREEWGEWWVGALRSFPFPRLLLGLAGRGLGLEDLFDDLALLDEEGADDSVGGGFAVVDERRCAW